MSGIIIVGLGPGDVNLMTRQAWQVLEQAGEVYLRTGKHPAAQHLPDSVQVHTFDYLYEQSESFEQVYETIIAQIMELGDRPQGIIYAVPGHPFVAEATGPEIARRARQEGIPLRVVEGLSFLEPTLTALGLDPFPQTSLVDALELTQAHVPPFPTSAPALIAQLYSREVAADVKLTLMSFYPDEHPVRLVHSAGTPDEQVEELALYEIDRSPHTGLLTCLYLPALPEETSFEFFLEVIAHLRAPDGCPWDRQQTHQTLRADLLEETYEALDALDTNDPDAIQEEFGDLLLQIVLQAQIASDEGEFTMADVLQGISSKIVRRHPHVFGEERVADAQGVLKNWERLKAEERAEKNNSEAGLLSGISLALPALTQAEQYQKRAARVGFDWPEVQGVLDKVDEEIQEVLAAQDLEEKAAEIGDLLFAVVNLARWYQVDAESALREANLRFRERFGYIERIASEKGRSLSDLSLDEMEALWQEAKRV